MAVKKRKSTKKKSGSKTCTSVKPYKKKTGKKVKSYARKKAKKQVMRIHKNYSNKVTNNFTEKEYYNASYGTDGTPFELSDKTIIAGQIIRDYFNVPMKVTSSFRTSAYDISKGRSGTGTHTLRQAVDYAFLDDNTIYKYHKEILERGNLYMQLRQAGINGFGLYDNFLHIDSRASGNTVDTNFGNFAFWDNRKKKSNP